MILCSTFSIGIRPSVVIKPLIQYLLPPALAEEVILSVPCVRLSVCLSVCLSALTWLNCLTCDLDLWHIG